jgi:hypothetical protein
MTALGFDEVRLWLTIERERIRIVGECLVEEGCALEFDPKRKREIQIIDALLTMVDERQSRKTPRMIGVISTPLAGERKAPQSGEGDGNARDDSVST